MGGGVGWVATLTCMHVQYYIGVIISKSYGLAKKTTAITVRVLNAGGSGSFA